MRYTGFSDFTWRRVWYPDPGWDQYHRRQITDRDAHIYQLRKDDLEGAGLWRIRFILYPEHTVRGCDWYNGIVYPQLDCKDLYCAQQFAGAWVCFGSLPPEGE